MRRVPVGVCVVREHAELPPVGECGRGTRLFAMAIPEPIRWDDPRVTWDSGLRYDSFWPEANEPQKHMDRVKLDLKSKNDPELAQFADDHAEAMDGNTNFTTPNPSTIDFAAKKDAFKAALQASNLAQETAKQKTLEKDLARAELEGALNIRASYVQSESKGDKAKILSANLDVRAAKTLTGDLPAPLDFLATMGDRPGEMDIVWSRVKGSKSYILQMSPADGARAWTQAAVVTKSKETVTGLTSGTRYAFRVAAVGTAGQSPWSDESIQMAP